MKKIVNSFIVILAICAIVTQVASIYFANSNALESIDATKLKAQISSTVEKNMQIEAQVLAFSSYNTIASRAADLGYSQSRDIVSVYDPQPLVIAR